MSDDEHSDSPGRGAIFVPHPRRTLTYRILRAVLKFVLRLWFRPVVEGPGSIPADGPVIITPVHRSFADFSLSVFLTDRKLFFIAKDSLWRSRLLGRFLLAMGAFPVHRESADRAALNHAQAVLEDGQVLVLFPEGTRQEGPLVQNLLEGASFLSARTQATIVPVGIGGSAKAMPKGSSIPRPVKVRLYVAEAMAPPDATGAGRVPRSVIKGTTATLRSRIQDAFDRASA